MKEIELVEKKDLREEYISKIEVLEKVKKLLLLPDLQLATTQQVADFYEIPLVAISSLLHDNSDELISDGYSVWKAENFKTFQKEELKTTVNRGSFEVKFSNGDTQKFSPRGIGLFPRRAILRVGMLLRDSEIAKEVRTQLLNIEEKTTQEQKVFSITEEQQLMLNVMCAKSDSDKLLAFSTYNDYKNRYIDSLQNRLDGLIKGILKWNPREGVNRMVRQIANKTFDGVYYKAWDKLSAEMLYKHNIGITARKEKCKLKKPTIFDVINETEMKLLVQSSLSLCETYKIDTSELFLDIH